MIKKSTYLLIGATAFLSGVVTSCNKQENHSKINPAEEIEITDIKNATMSDSLAYFMGQAAALTYWEQCEADSTISGEENARKFKEGFSAGIKQMQENRAFATGYIQGVMASEDVNKINDRLKLNLDPNRMSQGFNTGMKSKNAVDPVKLRTAMSALDSKVNFLMQQQGLGESDSQQIGTNQGYTELLQEAAKREGADKTTASGIRYKIKNPGKGESPVKGDQVTVSIAFKDLNGNIVQTTQTEQGEYVTFPLTSNDVPYKAMIEIIQTLKPGAEGIFIVPASQGEGKVGDHILDIKLSKVSKQ